MDSVGINEVKHHYHHMPRVDEVVAWFGDISERVSDTFQGMGAKFSTRSDDMTTEIFLSFLAKITISAVLPIASTMGVSYSFKKLTLGLTNPSLAQEIRMVHPYDQRKKALKAVVGPAFGAGGTAFFFTSYIPPFKQLLRLGTCLMKEYGGFETNKITNKYCYKYPVSFKTIAGFSAICGVAAAAYSGIKVLYEEYKANIKTEEPLPILNPDTSRALERIAKSTSDLRARDVFLQNVLFFGPGGTGKTMAAKAIAKNSDMNFVMMSGGDLPQYLEKSTHVSELNKLFAKIKGFQGPTVFFIDEAESLCRKRSDISSDMKRIELLNALLNLTGDNSKKIMLVLATNRPQDLDEAMLSRMDHKLYLGPPAYEQRKAIVKMHAEKAFTGEELALFDDRTLAQIAIQTEDMTGRALFKMINALSSNRKLEKDGRLTRKLIDELVKQFKIQERSFAKKSLYDRVRSGFWSSVGMPL